MDSSQLRIATLKFSHRVIFGAGILASVTLAPGAALACNPIEFLFGGCRPTGPVYRQEPLEEQLPAAAPKKRKAADVSSVGHKQTALAAPEGVPVGSVRHFSDDTTLRNGDVVVTPTGFLVYRGGRGGAQAFAPLGAGRGELATLERASKQTTGGDWSARSPLAVSKTPSASELHPVGARALSASAPAGQTQ